MFTPALGRVCKVTPEATRSLEERLTPKQKALQRRERRNEVFIPYADVADVSAVFEVVMQLMSL